MSTANPETILVHRNLDALWGSDHTCATILPFGINGNRFTIFVESIIQDDSSDGKCDRKFNIGVAEIGSFVTLPDTSFKLIYNNYSACTCFKERTVGRNFVIGQELSQFIESTRPKHKVVIIGALNNISVSNRTDLISLCNDIIRAYNEGYEDNVVQNALEQVAASRNGNSAETFRQALSSSKAN